MKCPHCGAGIPATQVFCRCMVKPRYKGKHRS